MNPLPHGGRLVDRVLRGPERERRQSELAELPQLAPFIDQVYDIDKISIGAYSPIEGFADAETLEAILKSGRLPNGLPWPIPMVLAPTGRENTKVIDGARAGDALAIRDTDGSPFALLHVEETFPFDRSAYAQGVYGTTDPAHPNVADVLAMGDRAIAGSVEVVRPLTFPTGEFEKTPAETRAEFTRRGWKNVAGYQTRNVPHTAHEYLQRCTLEREDVDGLLIHPVLGRLKVGDYRPDVILEAYRTLVRLYYPAERVYLSTISITMRYAGPKAALFFAIVRKNYGCGLYIIGRDQAGVGKYYDPFACHRIFDEFDVGVVPLRYQETYYCQKCGWMATPRCCPHPVADRVDTSQTRIRKALSAGEPLPTEILRPEIATILARGDVLLTA